MEKKCPCADPPGGDITCSDDQLAICGVIDGKLVVGCFDRPNSIMRLDTENRRTVALANWVLSRVMGTARSPDELISHEEMATLRAGVYNKADSKTKVKFSLPSDLDLQAIAVSVPAVMSR